jgi:hypothetical protein
MLNPRVNRTTQEASLLGSLLATLFGGRYAHR